MKTKTLIALFALVTTVAGAQNLRYEAEDGVMNGTVVAQSVPGFSGTGYVTGFDADGDNFQITADVPEGLYELWVGYRSVFGEKGYTVQVDDEFSNGMFAQSSGFSEDRAGTFSLAPGVNTLGVHKYWGYHDVDYLEFRPFTPPTLSPVAPTLVDAQADLPTRQLMGYLTELYGHKTLSGQQHRTSANQPFPGQAYLNKSGGLAPAVRGSDLMEYSPSRIQFGANPRNETEQSIAWAQQAGGVVTLSWHWNAPTDLINQPGMEWWRGFYTNATTFDLPGALANPGGSDYQLLLRDLDAIAAELQKFEDAGVPVVWRPLHEAQGGWFWWGAHGPDVFKELWTLTYERLTDHHGLHNLIWEFTSSAAEGDHLAWYPGDDMVDMIGLDIYTDPSSSMSGEWLNILEEYNGRKLIALSETGTLPDPDVMAQWGIEWSYFSPWTDFWQDFADADLQATLGHEDVITLDELPPLPWKEGAVAGDFNFDGVVDAADYVAFRESLGEVFQPADLQVWLANFGAASAGGPTLSVPEPSLTATVAGMIVTAFFTRGVRPRGGSR